MALLMPRRFTWLLNTSEPETCTHGFWGQARGLPGRNSKVAPGVFAQLERTPLNKRLTI